MDEQDTKNAAAIAWMEEWYATPDESPPGYWDAFEAFLAAHPITFGEYDENVFSE